MAVVADHFRTRKFLNRIDEVVVFHALRAEQIQAIARIQIDVLAERLAEQQLGLHVSDDAMRCSATRDSNPVYGARPLKRAIQQRVENPLAQAVLAGRFSPGDTVGVDASGGELVFTPQRARAA